MATPETSNPTLRPGMTYGMRECKRYITVHDEVGMSKFGPENALQYRERVGYALARSYALSTVPAQMDGNQDVQSYLSPDEQNNITSYARAGKEMTIPGGVSMLCVDLGPGCQSVMHRTVSVDFVIVTEGEIELELDSGETRLLYSGVGSLPRSICF